MPRARGVRAGVPSDPRCADRDRVRPRDLRPLPHADRRSAIRRPAGHRRRRRVRLRRSGLRAALPRGGSSGHPPPVVPRRARRPLDHLRRRPVRARRRHADRLRARGERSLPARWPRSRPRDHAGHWRGALTALHQARTIARLDVAEVLRSRWLFAAALTYAVLATVFIAVGLREAPLLGFTGSARVMFSLSHALLLLLPLVALTATAPAIGR